MKNKTLAERIIAIVDEMRENSSEMRMWKNIPLAKECMQLLREIDDPEETPMGKALACDAIREQLPEYHVPRFVLGILDYERELIAQAGDEAHESENYPTLEEVDRDIKRLKDYIDTDHVSQKDFLDRYERSLKFDDIERTPRWEEIYYEVEQECDRQLGDIPRGMGFCFAYWSTLRDVLSDKYGIRWHSLHELNPRVLFD
ncbi:MAG: hypothetical protein J6Y52_00880 [Bacteroidales bacterium]|nr:hypothetical protein [Bacteroidales bacterium]